jgi:hypothetical protein
VVSDAERIALQNAQREEELQRVPLQKIDKSKWPPKVRPISYDELDGLGVDDNGLLHWDGKPVEVGRRIDLTWTQTIIAIAVAVFTAIGALGALAQGAVAYHDWACKNKMPSGISCPAVESVRHSVPDSD